MKKIKYEPKLSKELKKHLKKCGTLDSFLNDYRQMCNNFKPEKIYIPGRESKPKNYDELDSKERSELEKLGKSYAHTLHQLLELGLKLHRKEKDYALIGGLGVLSHLYDHNPKFPLKWRGTEDIDILSKDNLKTFYLEMGFEKIPPERIDKSMIPDGNLDSYVLENPYHDRPLKIQDRRTIRFPGGSNRDESSLIHKKVEEVSLYGVPIKVPCKKHLKSTKSGIRSRKDKFGSLKDPQDIEHLKSVDELEDLLKKKGKDND